MEGSASEAGELQETPPTIFISLPPREEVDNLEDEQVNTWGEDDDRQPIPFPSPPESDELPPHDKGVNVNEEIQFDEILEMENVENPSASISDQAPAVTATLEAPVPEIFEEESHTSNHRMLQVPKSATRSKETLSLTPSSSRL
jgi:hypothetical protein